MLMLLAAAIVGGGALEPGGACDVGLIGSSGLKLRFAAKRGIELFHLGPKSCKNYGFKLFEMTSECVELTIFLESIPSALTRALLLSELLYR